MDFNFIWIDVAAILIATIVAVCVYPGVQAMKKTWTIIQEEMRVMAGRGELLIIAITYGFAVWVLAYGISQDRDLTVEGKAIAFVVTLITILGPLAIGASHDHQRRLHRERCAHERRELQRLYKRWP